MGLFDIINIKREAKLKGKQIQKQLDDKYIEKLKENHNQEMDSVRKELLKEIEKLRGLEESRFKEMVDHYKNEINRLQSEHKDNILEIRKQEKDYYNPLLSEKNNEIVHLQSDKMENKKYYENILNYGIMMENSSAQAIDIFQRAEMKITEFMNYMKSAEKVYGEAIQLINTGKAKIEYTQTQIEKERPKLLKGLKE
jgi:hypothetical protein